MPDTPPWRRYADHAHFVLLCALWYASSALSSNTGKSILNRFKYPVTLTFVQFGFVAFYSALTGLARARLNRIPFALDWHAWSLRKPNAHALRATSVMSLFQIAGHVFSSLAISRIPVSTVHTIKALSPLFTVISYAALFRVRYGMNTYTSLLPLTCGVMLACSFDLRANATGFLCALGSTLVFVSQNIYSKKLLPKESSDSSAANARIGPAESSPAKLDKLNLLLYSSGTAFILMIPIWLYYDLAPLLYHTPTPQQTSASSATLAFFFFTNGTVHFAQNLLAFSILARTSPVTYSIASLVKRIAVICLAILWTGQKVYFVQGVGIVMTFTGLWLYNRAKAEVDQGERKRGQMEKLSEMVLPSTSEDASLMSHLDRKHPIQNEATSPHQVYHPSSPKQHRHSMVNGQVQPRSVDYTGPMRKASVIDYLPPIQQAVVT